MHKWPPLLYAPSKWTSTKGNRVSRKLNMPSPTREHKERASRGSLKGLARPLPRCQCSRYPPVLAGARCVDSINYTVHRSIHCKGSFLKQELKETKVAFNLHLNHSLAKFGRLFNKQEEASHQMTKWPSCLFPRLWRFPHGSSSPPWDIMRHLPAFSASAFSM